MSTQTHTSHPHTCPLQWRQKSPRLEQAFSGSWQGPLFELTPSLIRREGLTLTTRLPVRLPNDGRFDSVDDAKATAQRVFERFVAGVAPATASPADIFTQFLQLLAFAPATHGRLLTTPATHDGLMTALQERGVPYEEGGDSAGDFVFIQLGRGYAMSVHNPLGPDYGYDFQIMGTDQGPMLSNTWREDPNTVAGRIEALLRIFTVGIAEAATP
ncbi:hypothetical protein ABZ468_50125 [Streptomyces sp. NPDC005708]|uniref:hypothetical protein n=1 Tax=Streptomyces sp. NPDC005708 TaxID=3154564 RepID=UPI0033C9B5A9